MRSITSDACDLYLSCSDCGASFLFSSAEQEFFSLYNLMETPKRCHNCRTIRRVERHSKNGRKRTLTALFCLDCKALVYVPFKPSGIKPVYCRSCMHSHSHAHAHLIEA